MGVPTLSSPNLCGLASLSLWWTAVKCMVRMEFGTSTSHITGVLNNYLLKWDENQTIIVGPVIISHYAQE